jgi:hypothetical protein
MNNATNGHGLLYLLALAGGVPTGLVLYEAIEYFRWLRTFRLRQQATPTFFELNAVRKPSPPARRNQRPSAAAKSPALAP